MTSTIPGLLFRDRHISVPVDWTDPTRFGEITVYAREVVDPARDGDDLPLLLFLQGGPGGQGPRPTAAGGWWSKVLETHRVVLLDQRGTGRSSRIDGALLDSFPTPAAAAEYVACFRADAIVEDAERLRHALYGGRRWTTLGQSYGGFITLSYLSRYPEALDACLTTGGIPSVRADAETVYARTFPRQLERNRAFEREFPDDVATLGAIADLLGAQEVLLPDGDVLTPHRLQVLGQSLGMSDGADGLHWLLESPFASDGGLDPAFLSAVGARTGYVSNPLYMLLQEVIYHQGEREPGWAAHDEYLRTPEFSTSVRPLRLTGETVYPWMFDEIRALRPFRGVAEALASRKSWPLLYDVDRLASNEVPLAAVQYDDDPYVDLGLARETLDATGSSSLWVTNEYLHDGLRADGARIVPRLFDMVRGRWAPAAR
ncbi:alpha/beta fold hydrolase [Paraoerskovia marina]|uniref:alpha/beta fold hydrolase n=1 Tax=Paraoerskovia marina TaxID=545619 RepID=UPI00049250F2|nr:alpha/beta fold hydrolase [Paraoerskovia marina]